MKKIVKIISFIFELKESFLDFKDYSIHKEPKFYSLKCKKLYLQTSKSHIICKHVNKEELKKEECQTNH